MSFTPISFIEIRKESKQRYFRRDKNIINDINTTERQVMVLKSKVKDNDHS